MATALAIAIAAAAALAWLYRRETRRLDPPWSWLLPLLRGGALALALLMLAGPVLSYQKISGSVPTIDLFIDASGSMLMNDSAQAAGPGPEGASPPPARLERAWELLTGEASGRAGWLDSVRQTHHVLIHRLREDDVTLLWDSRSDVPLPDSLRAAPVTAEPPNSPAAGSVALPGDQSSDASGSNFVGGGFTNLGDPIASRVLRGEGDQASGRAAVILLSDGQHNLGSPPAVWSQRLGDSRVPVHTIGFGSKAEPRDVAILGVNVPPSVSAGGRISGQVTIKDLAGAGEALRLRVVMGDQTVWEETLSSQGVPQRRVGFDFAVAPLIERLGGGGEGDVKRTRVTLPLSVSVDPIAGQLDTKNNRLDFRVSANLRQRKLLIVDSRSRWETRYLFNLFDRDPSWQVDTLIAPPRTMGGQVVRDRREGTFPADTQGMAAYDAVIWGDCGHDPFTRDELERLRDYVSQGGAIVFIDGDRNGLASLSDSPVGAVLPVKLTTDPMLSAPRSLRPTALGAGQAALRLGDDASVWGTLAPPTKLRGVTGLPGSEVWLETEPMNSSPPSPALVTRRFGGGQAVYLAFDQTWRWRYRVADRYHNRFWNQLLEAIMQPPFEVKDRYVSLAVGSPQYTAGDSATLRAQLRDASGKPVGGAIVEAILSGGAGGPETVLLKNVDADRGIYEGRSGPLGSGDYEISLRSAGYNESQAVKTSMLVVPPPDREASRLAQDVDLLGSLAESSGGVYADESEAQKVWDAIAPLSDGRIETRRYPLAESFPWFWMVIGLLTAEWWFRKKAGLI